MSHFHGPKDDDPAEALYEELPNASGGRRLEILFELGMIHSDRKEWTTAATVLEQAVALATELDWQPQRFDAAGHLMWTYRMLKQWEKLFALINELTPLTSLSIDPKQAEFYFRNCGFHYRDRRLAREAIWAFRDAEESAKAANESGLAARAMSEQATFHVLLREYDRAKELLVEALAFAREFADPFVAMIIQVQLGQLYVEIRDYGPAIGILREALYSMEAIKDEDWDTGECKRGLAAAYLRLGMREPALPLLDQLDNETESYETSERAELMLLRSEAATSRREAEEYRGRARALAANSGAHRIVNVCDINAALDAHMEEDWETAETLLRQVIASTEVVDDDVIASDAKVRLAGVLIETGRANEALETLRSLSVVNFGDATVDGHRYALAVAAALVEVGELDEAEATLGPITERARELETLPLIAEAYWVLSLIAEARSGRDATWEHFLGMSTGLSLRAGDTELAAERSLMLAQLDAPMPRERQRSVEEFVDSFDDESAVDDPGF